MMFLFHRRQKQTSAVSSSVKLVAPIPSKIKYSELVLAIQYAKLYCTYEGSGIAQINAMPSPFIRYLVKFEKRAISEPARKILTEEAKLALNALLRANCALKQRPTQAEDILIDMLQAGLKFEKPNVRNIVNDIANCDDNKYVADMLTKLRREVTSDGTLSGVKANALEAIDSMLEILTNIDGKIKSAYNPNNLYKLKSSSMCLHFDTFTKHGNRNVPWEDARIYLLSLPKHFLINYYKAKANAKVKESFSRIHTGACLEGGTRGYFDFTEQLPTTVAEDDLVQLQLKEEEVVPPEPVGEEYAVFMATVKQEATQLLTYIGETCTIESLSKFINTFYIGTPLKDTRDETYLLAGEKCVQATLTPQVVFEFLTTLDSPHPLVDTLTAQNILELLHKVHNLCDDQQENRDNFIYFLTQLSRQSEQMKSTSRPEIHLFLVMTVMENIDYIKRINNKENNLIGKVINCLLDKNALAREQEAQNQARKKGDRDGMRAAMILLSREKAMLDKKESAFSLLIESNQQQFLTTLLTDHLLTQFNHLQQDSSGWLDSEQAKIHDICIEALITFCKNSIPELSKHVIDDYKEKIRNTSQTEEERRHVKLVLASLCPSLDPDNTDWMTLFTLKENAPDVDTTTAPAYRMNN